MLTTKLGIDAGGTLTKVAYYDQETICCKRFDSTRPETVVDWINQELPGAKICLTGGKAALLQSLLHSDQVSSILEFDATCQGVKYLLHKAGMEPDAFILANVGTGTSIHLVDSASHTRLGGSGVGGGTLLGLARLLTGLTDYDQIIDKARLGQRGMVDLKVRDIYEGSVTPIMGDLTASNFGKINASSVFIDEAHLLAALVGLVGETVATASILFAEKHGVANIVYIGSTFISNESLKKIVSDYTKLRGLHPLFVQNGEFSGAVGALLGI